MPTARLTQADIDALLAGCAGAKAGPAPRLPGPKARGRVRRAKGKAASLPDVRFLALVDFCLAEGLPSPVKEWRFSERRWRWDYAWPDARPNPVALEIDGMKVWGRTDHQRPAGMENDRRKAVAGQLLGWAVVRMTSRMFDRGEYRAVLLKLLGERT